MDDFNVIARIQQLCDARGWSYYRLAKASDIPYSTLNTMFRKSYVPTVPSLQKICDGFGISLAQFFSERDEASLLTQDHGTGHSGSVGLVLRKIRETTREKPFGIDKETLGTVGVPRV